MPELAGGYYRNIQGKKIIFIGEISMPMAFSEGKRDPMLRFSL
jgi:hypothetical protein